MTSIKSASSSPVIGPIVDAWTFARDTAFGTALQFDVNGSNPPLPPATVGEKARAWGLTCAYFVGMGVLAAGAGVVNAANGVSAALRKH